MSSAIHLPTSSFKEIASEVLLPDSLKKVVLTIFSQIRILNRPTIFNRPHIVRQAIQVMWIDLIFQSNAAMARFIEKADALKNSATLMQLPFTSPAKEACMRVISTFHFLEDTLTALFHIYPALGPCLSQVVEQQCAIEKK